MSKNRISFALSLSLTLALLWGLSKSWGTAPPLGSFLNPVTGFWANAQTNTPQNQSISLTHEKLSDVVTIFVDSLDIPHIFAQNDTDLYFAQGYVTARDRLWQMEFQTHAAAGRLSEIVGRQALEYDRYQRHIGMVYAAEQVMKVIKKDKETMQALEAYAAGVNAWIHQLETAQLPLEYKLLDYLPEPWTPFKSALLFKYMTHMLARDDQDLAMSNTRAYFGDSFIKEILDAEVPWTDPIIPPDVEWNFDTPSLQSPENFFSPAIVDSLLPFQPNPANGSNNWAVSGDKTQSGYPILANDPHLNMSLPSLWYAIQLHSPAQNVMGVSLPGTPTVIIGHNEQVAWGTTNVGADVLDWYELEFRDDKLSAYKYEGEWRPTTRRPETIHIKGEPAITDTVIYTHYGPVVETAAIPLNRANIPVRHAMRWIAYQPSNEVKFFLKMNRAKNYADYREALRYYESPAQNWVFADSSDIALTVAGKFPQKWPQQGRFISDGSSKAYEWHGWIPFEHLPAIKNPDRGFVSSANQRPVANSYPYYLDDQYAPFERGRRINERLEAMDDITVEDLQTLQLDIYSYHAEKVLPLMLSKLQRKTLDNTGTKAIKRLESWNYENKGELIAPSIFKYWWDELFRSIWNDEYQQAGVPLRWPNRDQAAYLLLSRPELAWYDDITTEPTESRGDLIQRSFMSTLKTLKNEFGPFGDAWQWGYVNETTLTHLARLPGLGTSLFTDGGAESINAIRGGHGPSWRMIVELGPAIQAYGVYPGGQSGNPGSSGYTRWADAWNEGRLIKLPFFRHAPKHSDSFSYILRLE